MPNRWTGGFIQAYFDPLTVGPGTGQLGAEQLQLRLLPVQVGALTTWRKLLGVTTSATH
jgi:hypothetical protein